ncbi:V-type ATP synthase subunit I [Clostridia bacterium]|nr:V-type ATP synthase subunit I [Clostridia bacterium]
MNQKVKKIQIVGLDSEKRKTLEALKRTGCFELAAAEDTGVDGPDVAFGCDAQKEATLTMLARVRFAVEFTERAARDLQTALAANGKLAKKGLRDKVESDFKAKKPPMFGPRPEIGYDNFQLISARGEEVRTVIEGLEADSARLYAIKAEENRLKSYGSSVEPYIGLDAAFSAVRDTAHTFAALGTVPQKAVAPFKTFAEKEGLILRTFADCGGSEGVFVAGPRDGYDAAAAELTRAGFARCAVAADKTPADILRECAAEADALYYESLEILKKAPERESKLGLLKIYHDYLHSELENLNAQDEMFRTRKAFCVWGWYPEKDEEKVRNAAAGVSKYSLVTVRDPAEGEFPPTYIRNNALVEPFGMITNMFSPPSSKERDPNAFVGFFFWLFFGVMVADVAYGVILFTACLFILLKRKPERGTKNLLTLICLGGLSAVIWGVITGGWLGLTIGGEDSFFRGFIRPMDKDYMMLFLGLCLGLGVIHIIVGLCIKLAANLKARRYFEALADPGFLLIMFLGAFIWATSFIKDAVKDVVSIPDILPTIGVYIILAGLLGLMLTAGRGKKGMMKRFSAAFGSVYGLINYGSDILSYARLFGLGLAGGVIASVANQLGGMLFQLPVPGLNYVLGVAVAAVFHTFNIALGVLSAYVHDSRLQFVEFFGKFYEGGGRLFSPMGSGTKYVRVKN